MHKNLKNMQQIPVTGAHSMHQNSIKPSSMNWHPMNPHSMQQHSATAGWHFGKNICQCKCHLSVQDFVYPSCIKHVVTTILSGPSAMHSLHVLPREEIRMRYPWACLLSFHFIKSFLVNCKLGQPMYKICHVDWVDHTMESLSTKKAPWWSSWIEGWDNTMSQESV